MFSDKEKVDRLFQSMTENMRNEQEPIPEETQTKDDSTTTESVKELIIDYINKYSNTLDLNINENLLNNLSIAGIVTKDTDMPFIAQGVFLKNAIQKQLITLPNVGPDLCEQLMDGIVFPSILVGLKVIIGIHDVPIITGDIKDFCSKRINGGDREFDLVNSIVSSFENITANSKQQWIAMAAADICSIINCVLQSVMSDGDPLFEILISPIFTSHFTRVIVSFLGNLVGVSGALDKLK